MKDIRQTSEYANYLSKIGWNIEKIDGTYIFIKKFPFIGSVIKIQRPEKLSFAKIEKLAKKIRSFQIIIEPKNKSDQKKLKMNGFRLSKTPYLPSRTLRIDLTKSKEKIFNQLKKDCRYAIKKNENLEFKNYELNDLEKFRNFWKEAVGIKRYVPPLSQLVEMKKSFKEDSLFLTTENGESGAIFLNSGDISYYWQAFTNKVGRKKMYQYRIVWEGISWAKKKKAKLFDFEGIYDSRFPNKSWLGFTHFKKSFGGNEVEYPGCFVKNRLPI